VPQENVILNDTVGLSITLKTHGFKWLRYYINKPKIKIDFSKDVYKTENTFVYNKSKSYLKNTQFDKQVELLSISPDPITFRYGVNMIKKVPVQVNADIDFFPGFDKSSHLISEPDSIIVVGPNLLVSKINLLETEGVVLKDVRTNLAETVNLKLPINTPDLKFSATQIALKAEVEKFTEGTLNVPITVIGMPKNMKLKYFPKTVSVSYYVSLTDFDNIKPNNFKVVCDYQKTSANQSFLIPELRKHPESVKHVKLGQQRIEFIVTK
jgi:YbbR domain-containing protein